VEQHASLLSSTQCGDMTVLYLLQESSGQVGLWLVPTALQNRVVSRRPALTEPEVRRLPWSAPPAWAVDPLVPLRCVGDDPPAGFAQGRTMRSAPQEYQLRYRTQELARDAGETAIVTYLERDDGLACEHRLIHRQDDAALRVRVILRNTTPHPVTVAMLGSFALGGITPFASAQVFAPTAAFNMGVAAFFTKWARDCDDAQQPDGELPDVVPARTTTDGGPGWSDARVLCPWAMYVAYGDIPLLRRHYASMVRWLEWEASTMRDGLRCDDGCGYFQGYSDWLALDSAWQSVWSATPRAFIGTAYVAHSAGVLADIAALLGHEDDAARFQRIRATAVGGFNREFVAPSGRLGVQTQTAHLMALAWDLLPEEARPAAFDRLLALLEERAWHLSTGFLGTPLLCPVLTRFGRVDLAYKVFLQQDYPGWLFPVRNGATTMWERWNSWTPDRGFGDASMNSFNHYAYGAIGRWMYDTIAGLAPDPRRPGYKHATIVPRPGGGITHACASLASLHGRIETSWRIEEDRFLLDVLLPSNTTATASLPDGTTHELRAGRHSLACTWMRNE